MKYPRVYSIYFEYQHLMKLFTEILLQKWNIFQKNTQFLYLEVISTGYQFHLKAIRDYIK